MKTPVILLVLIISTCVRAQSYGAAAAIPRIDSSCVWHPPADFRKVMDKTCGALRAPAFQECFIKLMRDMGASSEALRFTSLTDTTGYVRHFVSTGPVDVAYVCYPFRANENFGITLVNGDPGMIDVDDFQYVDLTLLKKDSTYLKIVEEYPDAAVWPGDRFHFDRPKHESLPDGGQRFIVRYNLQNSCHACAHIGLVDFAFDFDRDGRFIGTRLVRVLPLVP